MSDIKIYFYPLIKLLFITLSALLLSACSVGISEQDENKTSPTSFNDKIQSMRTTPAQGITSIDSLDLQPGDILLSREPNLVSIGIRAFTASSVSHASVYVGDNKIAEAIGSGVQIVDLQKLMDKSVMVVAYRYPELTEAERAKVQEFSYLHQGNKYNFKGIALMIPYTLTRQYCELRPLSEEKRNECLHTLASAQIGEKSVDDQSFFCSEFVIEAYNYAQRPITDAAPLWISPDDLMHMREGDIKSLTPYKELIYVGHLKIENKESKNEI